MSLTILFKKPVDTGRANVSKEWDNANLRDFYLLTGWWTTWNVVETGHALSLQ